MPELPEVEVVRLGLEPVVVGARVNQVRILEPRSLRRHLGPEEDFVDRLCGARLSCVLRRGKFLWFPIEETKEALLVHLGMSGQLRIGESESEFGPLLRVQLFLTTQENKEAVVGSVDQRIFGSMAIDGLVTNSERVNSETRGSDHPIPGTISHIARDPMDEYFDERKLLLELRQRTTGIKRLLLDQRIVSGIGNIYADEALWRAKIHYETPANLISRGKVKELISAVKFVFGRALEQGGTSFDSQYLNVNGKAGYFSRSLEVYGRERKPCSRCGSLIRRDRFMNRSSYICPKCQRRRRTR